MSSFWTMLGLLLEKNKPMRDILGGIYNVMFARNILCKKELEELYGTFLQDYAMMDPESRDRVTDSTSCY